MDKDTIYQQNNFEDSELDILSLVKCIWQKRIFLVKVVIVFAIIGLFIAIFSPKVYTSSCTFVPQTSKKSSGSGLSSLAALAGISLGDVSSSETLSPVVYPQIIDNVDFKKELMYSKVKFSDYKEPIRLIDYYTNPDYAKSNIFGTIKKYTIGLPSLLLNLIRNKRNSDELIQNYSLKSYTKEEYDCTKILKECVGIVLEEKKGYITISATMNEPLAAAQLCQTVFDLLQKYITEFKIQKAQNQLSFINNRYEETKLQYEAKQSALASFMDANKVLSSAQAKIEQEKLASEYNLANAIYTEMAKQRLQADIQVKEDTPVLSVVKPVVVPFEKSAPNRPQILIIWIFLGIIFSSCLIIGVDWLKEKGIDNNFINKIVK